MKRILAINISCMLIMLLCSCTNTQIEECLEGNKAGNLSCFGFVAKSNETLYFMETEGGKAYLCKSDLKLRKKEVISDTFCQYINVMDNTIYYIGVDRKVYSMDTNGQNITKIYDSEANFLYAYKDRLYVITARKNSNEFWEQKSSNLVSMDFHGGNISILCEETVGGIYLSDDRIYCLYYDNFGTVNESSNLICFKLNGQDKELIIESQGRIENFAISNNFIYFVISGGTLVKYNMKDKDQTLLKSGEIMVIDRIINLSEDFAIYQDIYGSYCCFDFNENIERRLIHIKDIQDMVLQTEEYFFNTGVYIGDRYLYYYDDGKLELLKLK